MLIRAESTILQPKPAKKIILRNLYYTSCVELFEFRGNIPTFSFSGILWVHILCGPKYQSCQAKYCFVCLALCFSFFLSSYKAPVNMKRENSFGQPFAGSEMKRYEVRFYLKGWTNISIRLLVFTFPCSHSQEH